MCEDKKGKKKITQKFFLSKNKNRKFFFNTAQKADKNLFKSEIPS